jgi:transcriptional regulator with XRE-family HTH domain
MYFKDLEKVNNRISLILQAKNITPAQMADELGVQRSGISHIINGRNKPSLDFIQKIIKRYPDINMNWLIFGEGPMINPYPTINLPDVNKRTGLLHTKASTMELFTEDDNTDEQFVEQTLVKSESEISEFNINQAVEKQAIIDEKELNELNRLIDQNENRKHSSNVNQATLSSKKEISRIVIFYVDKTFSDYYPE